MEDKSEMGKNQKLGQLEDSLGECNGDLNLGLHLTIPRNKIDTFPICYSGKIHFTSTPGPKTIDYILRSDNSQTTLRICVSIPIQEGWSRYTDPRGETYLEANAVNFGPEAKIRIRPLDKKS